MLKLLLAATALFGAVGPALAWTDIYVDRAAMAEAGRQVCNINNQRLANRYKDRAAFFTGHSPESIDRQVEQRMQRVVGRLTNASAVRTFCIRIRYRDF